MSPELVLQHYFHRCGLIIVVALIKGRICRRDGLQIPNAAIRP